MTIEPANEPFRYCHAWSAVDAPQVDFLATEADEEGLYDVHNARDIPELLRLSDMSKTAVEGSRIHFDGSSNEGFPPEGPSVKGSWLEGYM